MSSGIKLEMFLITFLLSFIFIPYSSSNYFHLNYVLSVRIELHACMMTYDIVPRRNLLIICTSMIVYREPVIIHYSFFQCTITMFKWAFLRNQIKFVEDFWTWRSEVKRILWMSKSMEGKRIVFSFSSFQN